MSQSGPSTDLKQHKTSPRDAADAALIFNPVPITIAYVASKLPVSRKSSDRVSVLRSSSSDFELLKAKGEAIGSDVARGTKESTVLIKAAETGKGKEEKIETVHSLFKSKI